MIRFYIVLMCEVLALTVYYIRNIFSVHLGMLIYAINMTKISKSFLLILRNMVYSRERLQKQDEKVTMHFKIIIISYCPFEK